MDAGPPMVPHALAKVTNMHNERHAAHVDVQNDLDSNSIDSTEDQASGQHRARHLRQSGRHARADQGLAVRQDESQEGRYDGRLSVSHDHLMRHRATDLGAVEEGTKDSHLGLS